MSNILLKRGTSANFNSLILKAGEPAFVTDSGKFYIGTGIQKILINPVDKPVGINVTNFYPKVKVNEYGQVVSQSTLSAADIPVIPSSGVSGLGTASLANTGANAGNVPILNSSGKLADSVLPSLTAPSYIFAYYIGASGLTVASNQIIPLNTYAANGNSFTFDNNGTITINELGTYIISYNITSNSLQISTALSYAGGGTWTGTAARCSTTAIPAYVTTCATVVRQVATVPEKYAIKNMGATDIALLSGYGSISIAKIK